MKMLPVRKENVMVARVRIHGMRQDRGEPIHAYGARLQGQESVCKHTQQCKNCETTVNYTEAIVQECVMSGVNKFRNRAWDKSQDMTLG